MRKSQVEIGAEYQVKVSNKLARVKIVSVNQYGGWNGINIATNREIRIHTAGKLRRKLEPKKVIATELIQDKQPELSMEHKKEAGYIMENGKPLAAGVVCRCNEPGKFCPMHGKFKEDKLSPNNPVELNKFGEAVVCKCNEPGRYCGYKGSHLCRQTLPPLGDGPFNSIQAHHRLEQILMNEAITIDPDIRGGVPVLTGTRISVSQILSLIADGDTPDAIASEYDIDKAMIKKLLVGISRCLDQSYTK